jgi:hypothetical protein
MLDLAFMKGKSNNAQCNSLMMDTQYPKHVGEEMTAVGFIF